MQGATSSAQSMSELIGPFLFTLPFVYFIGDVAPLKMPGAPFFLAGALLLLALGIAWRATVKTTPQGGQSASVRTIASTPGMVDTARAPLPTLQF
ncbi:hypothetical protein ACVW17_006056 [Bradyrhizobium sp. USDA 4473]